MVCHSFTPLVVLITALFCLQAQCKPVYFQKRGFCATEDPDASFLDAVQNVKVDETRPDPAGSQARKGPIEIETWFHIISSKSEEHQVSDNMIDDQVSLAVLPSEPGLVALTRRPLAFYFARRLRGCRDQV